MNPKAGGAERLTYEVARRLVAQGHSVEWFSAAFQGAASEEVLDGIRICRAGRQWTVHWHAFKRYRGTLGERFDAVVDEVNTVPFFTPFWTSIPTFMLIFQLAREVWWYETPFPLSAIGYFLEPFYLMGYRDKTVLTISESTARDLRGLGFRGTITLVPVGIEPIAPNATEKTKDPTFLYVGRLSPSKRIEHILQGFALFRRSTGTGALWLVGSGSMPYRQSLRRLVRRLKIQDSVVFWGWVSSVEKHRLMSEAHALLMTSAREGWGLVVTEASACGTPAIVYDVPGLRDAVRHEATGLVVQTRPQSLADAMVRLMSDSLLYHRLATEGRRWSGTFSFDEAARQIGTALQQPAAG